MIRVLVEAVGGIRRAPLLSGTAALMIGLAFFVLGIFGLAVHNLNVQLGAVAEEMEVVLFLSDDASTDEIDRIRDEIGARTEVTGVEFVSKEDARRRALEDFPGFEDVFGSLDGANPLPRSLEISIRPGDGAAAAADRVRAVALAYPLVEDADQGDDLIAALSELRSLAAVAAAALGVVLSVVAALITASALRVVIFSRRDEIYVMRLVGARDRFVRSPFLVEGALVGITGGGLAFLLTWGAYQATLRLLFPLEWMAVEWAAGGLAASTVFGVASSLIAIRGRLEEPAS